ncbi:uncharacterized protein LOC129774532 [Toxorhynchites rutilus septentrionalis]|uniref:uncharacterized protein LOC129774532 n=1 Tax=Toxorhynchites rutilus septentrionalis TaxID=329112 RepID=UPI002479DC6B|nr:uncharacterized protein LOC129774532 [Toxorhynchites rutilus septentrionalis]
MCGLCGESGHEQFFCEHFKALPVTERLKWVTQHSRCQNCLCEVHENHNCSSGTCKRCNLRPHTLLHEEQRYQTPQHFRGVRNHLSYNNASCSVFLATAIVNVMDAWGNLRPATALLDSGSQTSFITSSLSKKLGLHKCKVDLPLTGISGLATKIREAASLTIQSRNSDFREQTECAILDKISEPIPCRAVNVVQWEGLADHELADKYFNIPGNIDLLIDASMYYHLLESEKISLGSFKPILQKTKLGWIVAGSHESGEQTSQSHST